MTTARFLQIHTLHPYSAALLNRDDSGLAKRMPYGDVMRTRISSQCLKRHWRVAEDQFALKNISGVTEALRSREVVSRSVMRPIREAGGASEEIVKEVEDAFQIGIYGDRGTSRDARQPLLLGLPEVEYLQAKAAEICANHPDDASAARSAANDLFSPRRGEGNNFRAFRDSARLPGGLEGALFGRMVTSDPGANIDAAVHVAHAFTVHQEESESDYFSVVDDLTQKDEDPGAAHIGDMELTAGLFYGYVVVDVPSLVSNLEGCPAEDWTNADRALAGKVVHNLVNLIATVTPGAKRGSTAPYSYADLTLIEAGARQPRSLANAYRKATTAQTEDAAQRLAEYLGKLDDNYGAHEARRVTSVDDHSLPKATRLSLDDLASWVQQAVVTGQAV